MCINSVVVLIFIIFVFALCSRVRTKRTKTQRNITSRLHASSICILQLNTNGTHKVLSEHLGPRIPEEAKQALRTPGMAVRWHDGHIEEGKE